MRIPPKCHAAQLKVTAALKAYRKAMDTAPVPATITLRTMREARVALGEADLHDTRPMPTDKRKGAS